MSQQENTVDVEVTITLPVTEPRFAYGQPTIPEGWEESYDHSWIFNSHSGFGIVPESEKWGVRGDF